MKTLRYKTPKQLEKRIDAYFESTDPELYTISGLCLWLQICKDTLYEYNKRDEYKDVVDMARLRIENSYELDFRVKGRASDIFAMKNFGWRDKQETDLNVGVDDENAAGVVLLAPVLERKEIEADE